MKNVKKSTIPIKKSVPAKSKISPLQQGSTTSKGKKIVDSPIKSEGNIKKPCKHQFF
jgi:hypothetical protein